MLFVDGWSLVAARCVLFVVRYVLIVVICGLSLVACCSLCDVGCRDCSLLLVVVRWSLCFVCCV